MRRLYIQHGPALVAYVCSFVRDRAVAEDTVRHAFLHLLSAGIARPDVLSAYVYRGHMLRTIILRRQIQDPATCRRVILAASSCLEIRRASSAFSRAKRSITRAMTPVHPV